MIGADEIADRAALRLHQLGAAVAADIMEGPQPHVVVAQDDDGILAERDGDIITGLRHLGLDRRIDPGAAEDEFHIGLENLGAGIEGRLQAVARLAPRNQ